MMPSTLPPTEGTPRVESTDLELLDRARAGDQRAFGELVSRYKGRTWAVCLRIAGNPHDAEDALQNALTAAWQNLDKFRGDARFSTWLHRIAANAALAVIRKRRETPDENINQGLASDAPRIDERVAVVEAVQSALSDLPEAFREAIVLREYAELTYADIATHQGVPVQTVKSRINRGRTQLREILAPVI